MLRRMDALRAGRQGVRLRCLAFVLLLDSSPAFWLLPFDDSPTKSSSTKIADTKAYLFHASLNKVTLEEKIEDRSQAADQQAPAKNRLLSSESISSAIDVSAQIP